LISVLVLAFVIHSWEQQVDKIPGPNWWWYYLGDETYEEKMDRKQLDESLKAWELRMEKKKAEEAIDEEERKKKLINHYLYRKEVKP